MELTDIVALTGTVGGMQGLIELVRWWQSRRLRLREEEANISSIEDENGRKQIDWLESRLAERDVRIDTIYTELRKEQGLRLAEIHSRHEVELRLAEAEARKCCVRGCSRRVPPSEY